MSKQKPLKYDRIMQRPDKRKPPTLAEFIEKHCGSLMDTLVMDVKLLTKESIELRFQWSEKIADET
jgi:hypothetical protein